MLEIKELKVQIVAFVDSWQPGWIKCVFQDVYGKDRSIIEKVPVINNSDLNSESNYPTEGFIACEIISQSVDTNNKTIVTINLAKPYGISAEDGQVIFEVFLSQIK